MILTMLLILAAVSVSSAFAEEESKRTVLLYICGSNLETEHAMATFNLKQILRAKFSADDNVKVVIMTGGARTWHMESSSLYDPAADKNPEAISSEYNQIWEAKGADAGADDHAGQMVLLDGDGIMGDGDEAKKSEDELMTDPEVLKAFIDYGVKNYPADKYDLILWDHGGGPTSGFGQDQHAKMPEAMPLNNIIDAVSDNEVIRTAGKFDFIDFDACLMSSVELVLSLTDYADFYIASPETEPGYGQPYDGWLTKLGEDPAYDTYKLGKMIVDDFIQFYDEGEGQGANGTLSVIDLKKLAESDFVPALKALDQILRSQATTPTKNVYQFYDELGSASQSILYGGTGYYDLGNMAELLAVTKKEADEETIEAWKKGEDLNPYKDVSKRILTVLGNDDIIYGQGTKGIKADPQIIRDKNGDQKYEELRTSGLYLFFPQADTTGSVTDYYDVMSKTIETMRDEKSREFLRSYIDTVIDYALLAETGRSVSEMCNVLGKSTSEISYDSVKSDYWELDSGDGNTVWKSIVKPLLDRNGGEDASRAWLTGLIEQQRSEMVSMNNVSAYIMSRKQGNGSRVVVRNTGKRVIASTDMKISPEIPAAMEYIKNDPKASQIYSMAPVFFDMTIGHETGEVSYDDFDFMTDDVYAAWLEWYNSDTSAWDLPQESSKWYAVKDADGTLHVANVLEDENEAAAYIRYKDEEGESRSSYFVFAKDGSDELKPAYFLINMGTDDNQNYKPVQISEIRAEMSDVMMTMNVNIFGLLTFNIPISESSFTITPENIDKLTLVYTDTADISDISSINYKYSITDIYGTGLDITEKVHDPAGTLIDIGDGAIKPSSVYNGKDQDPVVTYDGKVLKKGVDYTILKFEPCRDVGEYQLSIRGRGAYALTLNKTFRIDPKGTSLKKVKRSSGKAITVKWKKQSAKMSKSRITGYQIQVATNRKFTKNKKTLTVKGYGKTSKRITKLKAKKKYYVRIRTYKIIGKEKYYSPWSTVKSVKTRSIR